MKQHLNAMAKDGREHRSFGRYASAVKQDRPAKPHSYYDQKDILILDQLVLQAIDNSNIRSGNISLRSESV